MKRALIITAGGQEMALQRRAFQGRSGEVMKIARIRTQSAWTEQKVGLTNRTAGRKTIYYPRPGSEDSAADLVVLQDLAAAAVASPAPSGVFGCDKALAKLGPSSPTSRLRDLEVNRRAVGILSYYA